MRTVAVVTVARSDYGILVPILRRIERAPDLRLRLVVAGMHLAPEFGQTQSLIEDDGFEIANRVEMTVSSDTPEGVGKSLGLGLLGFAQLYSAERPDLLLVLGDRFEMLAAALAALPFKIPVAHIHGGESTLGAIDEAMRHCITKLSHLHFVATADAGRRVRQLGEEGWRITISGAPSLDQIHAMTLLDRRSVEARFGLRLDAPPLLVTYHPVTLEYEESDLQVTELLAALDDQQAPVVFTLPNADTGGRELAKRLREHVRRRPGTFMVENLGTQGYFSLMALSAAMVGNSSSGIIEAASFRLPVVNVGNRQEGRLRPGNVIDVGNDRKSITRGIRKALDPLFRESLAGLVNPYGTGQASEVIVDVLRTVTLDSRLIRKRFSDLPVTIPAESYPVL